MFDLFRTEAFDVLKIRHFDRLPLCQHHHLGIADHLEQGEISSPSRLVPELQKRFQDSQASGIQSSSTVEFQEQGFIIRLRTANGGLQLTLLDNKGKTAFFAEFGHKSLRQGKEMTGIMHCILQHGRRQGPLGPIFLLILFL